MAGDALNSLNASPNLVVIRRRGRRSSTLHPPVSSAHACASAYGAGPADTKYGFEAEETRSTPAASSSNFGYKDVARFHASYKTRIAADLLFNLSGTVQASSARRAISARYSWRRRGTQYAKSKSSSRISTIGNLSPYGPALKKTAWGLGEREGGKERARVATQAHDNVPRRSHRNVGLRYEGGISHEDDGASLNVTMSEYLSTQQWRSIPLISVHFVPRKPN
ncbi:hypothetical protein B0H15DRAFT_281868 [Mycena belliarum]|uniref:Uncharacterized protein n=1 Tax=Mycena belliarum TaxID=1033014 RepID=A0AAD6U476_9AGAR|nr:hypothetical protein B0H15DRAFT_281868 [Mycena belliae]